MKKQNHLPIYGVGPIYVAVITLLTLGGILLVIFNRPRSWQIKNLFIPMCIIGAVLIAIGALLWINANFKEKIGDGIVNNLLITSGVYAWVRNPIYSAFLLIYTGAILIACNLWLLILPILYWIFLTVLMKCTEEKWLLRQYEKKYENYCKRTNRCIPWFPKKQEERKK